MKMEYSVRNNEVLKVARVIAFEHIVQNKGERGLD